MADFYIKNGGTIDTQPPIEGTLTSPTGAIIDLSTASSVQLTMTLIDYSVSYVRTATIETPASSGKVFYAWNATTDSTIAAGLYYAEWRVFWASNTSQRVPNKGYFFVEVDKGLS